MKRTPYRFDPDTRVLRDDELDAVSGGEVSHHDFVIVKLLDKATPILFLA
jgi:type VI protein secretion system component Hcp